jgi:hypothetical protein
VSQCTAVDEVGKEITFDPSSPGTPTPITVDNQDQLSAIACPSASQCTAVDENGLEVTFNPGSPGAVTPVVLATGDAFSGVACPSTRQCSAVDDNGHAVTFDPTSVGAPALVPLDPGNALTGVACPSASQCTAVGTDGRAVIFATALAQASGSLSGVAKSRPRLEVTIASTPPITTVTIGLPRGLAFARARKGAVTVRGAGGRRLRFAVGRRHGALRILLRAPTSTVMVIVSRAALSVTGMLAQRVRVRAVKTLGVRVTTGRQSVRLRLKV